MPVHRKEVIFSQNQNIFGVPCDETCRQSLHYDWKFFCMNSNVSYFSVMLCNFNGLIFETFGGKTTKTFFLFSIQCVAAI